VQETLYKSYLVKVRIFEGINLSIRLFILTSVILISVYYQSVTLFTLIIFTYILFRVVIRILRYFIRKYFPWNNNQEMIEFGKLQRKRKSIGNYKYRDIHNWIINLCEPMKLKPPKNVIIYDTKQANAFAEKQKYWIFLERNNIHLFSNLFYILDESEINAVIAHELGHFKNYMKKISFFWIIPPLIFYLLKYFRWLEYLADYQSAKYVGMVPCANALIKIYHRGHMFTEILNRLYYIQMKFNFSNNAIFEMNTDLERILPHNLKDESEIIPYVEMVIDNYFKNRSEHLKGLGKEFTAKYKKSRVKENRELKRMYDILDWRLFDNRIKDNFLDEDELMDLYRYLKGHENARFFISYLFKDKKMERFSTHPSLRERIMFLVETFSTMK